MSDGGRQIGNCKHARTRDACVDCLRAALAAVTAERDQLRDDVRLWERLTASERQFLCVPRIYRLDLRWTIAGQEKFGTFPTPISALRAVEAREGGG
jgi:hypothetical protein